MAYLLFWLAHSFHSDDVLFCFGWRILFIQMTYLLFWLAYSFHSDGVLIVLVGVFFSYRWHTWYFGWRNILIKMVYLVFWLAYSFHSDGVLAILVGVVFWLKLCTFAFSLEKSTPAWKKYANAVTGVTDYYQVWIQTYIHCIPIARVAWCQTVNILFYIDGFFLRNWQV